MSKVYVSLIDLHDSGNLTIRFVKRNFFDCDIYTFKMKEVFFTDDLLKEKEFIEKEVFTYLRFFDFELSKKQEVLLKRGLFSALYPYCPIHIYFDERP